MQHDERGLALNQGQQQPQQQQQQQQYTTTYTSVPAYNPVNSNFAQSLNQTFNQPIHSSSPSVQSNIYSQPPQQQQVQQHQQVQQQQVQHQPLQQQHSGPRIPEVFKQHHHLTHIPNVNIGPPAGVRPESKDYSFSTGPGHQVQVHEEAYQSPPDA